MSARRLVLMRHAKSDWSEPERTDHDRPLAQRGRLAAPLMAAFLAELDLALDHIWCSTARRTRDTWERMRPLLAAAPAPSFEAALYTEDPERVLATLRRTPAAARTVLALGHNPAFEETARLLSDASASAPERFPTAAVAVFEIDGDWADLGPRRGALTAFASPKTLV